MKRTAFLSMFVFIVPALIAAVVSTEPADPNSLTTHEWGTFTSVAGENGEPIAWRTYGGPNDLPCFVERFPGPKGGLYGTVRMETPVVYFYGNHDTVANVKVHFPKGTMTEWYPKAVTSRSYDTIEWRDVRVSPDGPKDFPAGRQENHYYAARETDATPLQVGQQKEKFLFYRGVGTFPLPITAKTMTDGKILVQNTASQPVAGVILFENRGGQRRYRVEGKLQSQRQLDPHSLRSDWPGLLLDLERILVDEGLYPREARAMIETWRDSWFEEGTRLFYIVPQHDIDSILPLEIQPAPARVTRVFVGRMEIITSEIQEDVRQALAKSDYRALEKYGRFLGPIANRIGVPSSLVDSLAARSATATCVQ